MAADQKPGTWANVKDEEAENGKFSFQALFNFGFKDGQFRADAQLIVKLGNKIQTWVANRKHRIKKLIDAFFDNKGDKS